MTTVDRSLQATRPFGFRARFIVSSMAEALAWPVRVVRARRLLTQIGMLDDRALRDIGLCRQDLRDATALPLDADPSMMFWHRAQQRRQRF